MRLRVCSVATLIALSSGLTAIRAGATVLLSTDFATPTTIDGIPFTDAVNTADSGSKSVGWVGANWTVGNSALVDLRQVTSVTFGDFTWGSAADTIKAGEIWTTLAGGDYIATNNSQLRHTGSTGQNIQLNSSSVGNSSLASSADGTAIYNLVFEVKPGDGIKNLQVAFRTGTAQTSGTWDNNTAAGNGNYNVSILDSSNTATAFSFYATSQGIGAGAGPSITAVDQTSSVLVPGTYLMQIVLSGKTTTQRYSLDDFAFSADAVPEPGIAGVFSFVLLGALARRSRKYSSIVRL